ncbi:MAG TPA: response regulator [Devosia sp.]|jgi:CheY-like chemotaxis protein|nr:response regulator [Devosia sp.]
MASLSHLKRVLVAEDEALILLDVAQSLEDFGVAEVVTVTTVEEALMAISAGACDAVVLDVHLGRSGSSAPVAEQLRARGIPFIVTSGSEVDGTGHAGGPVLAKPFSSAQLVDALNAVTSAHRSAVA